MKVVTFSMAGVVIDELKSIQLTESERNTFRKASKLLTEIRELREADGIEDDTDQGTDIALAAYTCLDLAEEEIKIP